MSIFAKVIFEVESNPSWMGSKLCRLFIWLTILSLTLMMSWFSLRVISRRFHDGAGLSAFIFAGAVFLCVERRTAPELPLLFNCICEDCLVDLSMMAPRRGFVFWRSSFLPWNL